ELPAHLEYVRMREANDVDGDQSHLPATVVQHHRAGFQGIMYPGGLAVLAEAGHVDRFIPKLGSNIGLRKARLKLAGLSAVRHGDRRQQPRCRSQQGEATQTTLHEEIPPASYPAVAAQARM